VIERVEASEPSAGVHFFTWWTSLLRVVIVEGRALDVDREQVPVGRAGARRRPASDRVSEPGPPRPPSAPARRSEPRGSARTRRRGRQAKPRTVNRWHLLLSGDKASFGRQFVPSSPARTSRLYGANETFPAGAEPCYAGVISSLFAPSSRMRRQTARKASASWSRAKTFTAIGPSGIEGVASRS